MFVQQMYDVSRRTFPPGPPRNKLLTDLDALRKIEAASAAYVKSLRILQILRQRKDPRVAQYAAKVQALKKAKNNLIKAHRS